MVQSVLVKRSKSSSEKSTGLSRELCRLGDSASDICRQESPEKKFKSGREEEAVEEEEADSEDEAVAGPAEEEEEQAAMAVVVVLQVIEEESRSCSENVVQSGRDTTTPSAEAPRPTTSSARIVLQGWSAVGVGVNEDDDDEGDLRWVGGGGVSAGPDATGSG